MPLNKKRTRNHLGAFGFTELFVEELGWDHYQARPLNITVDNETYKLDGLVEKRGMVVFRCNPDTSGAIPLSPVRRKIENQVRKTAHEHIIIYHDAAKTRQKWQWVRREAGRPSASREHDFSPSQSGEALLQKLAQLEIAVEEETGLTITEVSGRVRAAFDVDRVTKRFYDRFKQEHAVFLKFIKGIETQADREWYASLMLNRLMFCYFVQRKGFLDNDTEYLRNRLTMVKERKGKDKFFCFYRHFLLRLFHEGLGAKKHSSELDALIGNVPYLNGGFFDIHKLEQENKEIDIPDKAFEKVFDFFDQYQWHLDERPLRKDNEINPDVLGYIFEKYINQKQMGAYYTKEDITGYISKNTIVPWLFDTAKKKCEIAFKPDSALWRLLQDDPDRYIYPAMRKGVIAGKDDIEASRASAVGKIIPLPPEIEKGVSDVSKRGNWNTSCDLAYALPTEIWREHVARRKRTLEIRDKLLAGEIHEINDLITYNLDIVQFAEDAIDACEGPELLRALYGAITSISILDPTCGSGAFLFAALNILESLYDACIDRMQWFVDNADHNPDPKAGRKYKDFRETLAHMASHPSRGYFILKSIIINNLYGVDIMEEAIEICKLRLFLKLVAQVETAKQIEPLPDIDFNIKAGNTLVGFATLDQFKNQSSLDAFATSQYDEIVEDAEKISMAFSRFKSDQLEDKGTDSLGDSKKELNKQLEKLNDKLNKFLAVSYLGAGFKKEKYEQWKASHQPFHWFAEFYEIMHRGGFDVVIGNPPYVEYSKVRNLYTIRDYSTEPSGNLYAFTMERTISFLQTNSKFGMIVPIASISVSEVTTLRKMLNSAFGEMWISNFAIRPAKLFEGVEQRLSIFICHTPHTKTDFLQTTKYHQWYKDERPILFDVMEYSDALEFISAGSIPKIGGKLAHTVFKKIQNMRGKTVAECIDSKGKLKLIFHRTPGYWIRIMDFKPYFKSPTADRSIHHIREIDFQQTDEGKITGAFVSSSAYFFWFFANGNCRNLTLEDVRNLHIGCFLTGKSTSIIDKFDALMRAYKTNSVVKTRGVTEFDEINWTLCKDSVDDIDKCLAPALGFTAEETDFVVNYDIKIRMTGELEGD